MFGDLGKQAFNALRHNRRRSVLTMLGMAWGIATVVLLLAYGAGFENALMIAFRRSDVAEVLRADIGGVDHQDPRGRVVRIVEDVHDPGGRVADIARADLTDLAADRAAQDALQPVDAARMATLLPASCSKPLAT